MWIIVYIDFNYTEGQKLLLLIFFFFSLLVRSLIADVFNLLNEITRRGVRTYIFVTCNVEPQPPRASRFFDLTEANKIYE